MSVCATLSTQSLYFSSSLKSYSLAQCARKGEKGGLILDQSADGRSLQSYLFLQNQRGEVCTQDGGCHRSKSSQQ